MSASLVGSEMCIRDKALTRVGECRPLHSTHRGASNAAALFAATAHGSVSGAACSVVTGLAT
eukprot:4185625-Alexandrium_andersonii.AAC.1